MFLKEARSLGFKAMQYNLVVFTNIPAVKLYQKMGFKIVSALPKAFNHMQIGYVDAYVMHCFLSSFQIKTTLNFNYI
jgi:ribosomal protein S18 acetylase RimI-like enzyme